MLRVGLTGELGSGKSTVARMLAKRGAVVLSSDEMGRALMQPGQAVYAAIVAHFGDGVLQPDGELDRGALAALAFDAVHPRVEELNAMVHPAVIAEQARVMAEIASRQPEAILVVESALVFSTTYGSGWRRRFDCVVLVTAPDEVKVRRFVERSGRGQALSAGDRSLLEAEARRRIARQSIRSEDAAGCIVVENSGDLKELETRVDGLWMRLEEEAGYL